MNVPKWREKACFGTLKKENNAKYENILRL